MKKIIQLLLIFVSLSSAEVFGKKEEENQRAYERFIGLGSFCITRMQINHHLSQRFGKDANSFGGGQLFDWLIIHDYNKLAKALENDLSDLLEKKDLLLAPTWVESISHVKNIKYHMTWSHLFSKNADGLLASNIIDLEYKEKKRKIDYLSEKFKQLKQYRTLYIIAYPFTEPAIIGVIEPDKSTLIRIRNALRKMRGNNNFTLLFCPIQKKITDFENICVRTLLPVKDPLKEGFEHWNLLLAQFPFNIDKAELDNDDKDNSYFGRISLLD